MCAYTKEEWARISKKASIAHILELGLRLFDESWQVPKTILGGRLLWLQVGSLIGHQLEPHIYNLLSVARD